MAILEAMAELRQAVIDTLQDAQYGFDPNRKIRIRSSTNVAAGDQVIRNPELFTKDALIHLAAGGQTYHNSEPFTRELLILWAAGGQIFP